VHSLTGSSSLSTKPVVAEKAKKEYNDDPFGQSFVPAIKDSPDDPGFTLKNAPKWLTRPCSATWGFGGRLVCVKKESRSIEVSRVLLEFGERAQRLYTAVNGGDVNEYCDYKAQGSGSGTWNVLKSLVGGGRAGIVASLGFDASSPAGALTPLFEKLVLDSKNAVPKGKSSGAFNMFKRGTPTTKKDTQIDTIITRALLLGDFSAAVQACIAAERLSDALAIAASSPDPALLVQTRATYLESGHDRAYIRLLNGIIGSTSTSIDGNGMNENTGGNGIGELIDNCILDPVEETWKDLICMVCTYGGDDDVSFQMHVGRLAARLDRREYVPGTFASPGKDEGERRAASMLCHLLARDGEKVLAGWLEELDVNVGRDAHVETLQSLVERVLIFSRAVPAPSDPEFALSRLYDGYREYAVLLSQHGLIDFAWRVLQLVPVEYYRDLVVDDGLPQWDVLCDRVYQNPDMSVKSGDGRDAPVFPFVVADVPRAPVAAVQPRNQSIGGGQGSNGYGRASPQMNGYHPRASSIGGGQPSYGGYQQNGGQPSYGGYQQNGSSNTQNQYAPQQNGGYQQPSAVPNPSQNQYAPQQTSGYQRPAYQQPAADSYGGGYAPPASTYGRPPPAAVAPPPMNAPPPTPAFTQPRIYYISNILAPSARPAPNPGYRQPQQQSSNNQSSYQQQPPQTGYSPVSPLMQPIQQQQTNQYAPPSPSFGNNVQPPQQQTPYNPYATNGAPLASNGSAPAPPVAAEPAKPVGNRESFIF
jgi:protein transport protein SEC31